MEKLQPAKPAGPGTVDLSVLKEWPPAVRDLAKAVETFPARCAAEVDAARHAYQGGLVTGVVVGLLAAALLARLFGKRA